MHLDMTFSADMGCGGDWLKKLSRLKKAKGGGRGWIKGSSKKAKSNGIVREPSSKKSSTVFANAICDSNGNCWVLGRRIEDVAATKIQTSFRAYKARKSLRELKRAVRLKKILTQRDPIKNLHVSILNHFHTYSKIQEQIKARRLSMVVEGRIRQKKLENQLKVDAKLHEIETEWSSTPQPMDVIKAKIHYREEAAMKRERALSYAFNHQWRANASLKQLMGNAELGKAEWGWSWMERWIAARPWESPIVDTLKAEPTTPTLKIGKTKTKPNFSSTPTKLSSSKHIFSGGKGSSPKRTLSNGKRIVKPQRRLSFSASNKPAAKNDIELKPTKFMKDQEPVTGIPQCTSN